jgi:SAM-dependent methyltransferase
MPLPLLAKARDSGQKQRRTSMGQAGKKDTSGIDATGGAGVASGAVASGDVARTYGWTDSHERESHRILLPFVEPRLREALRPGDAVLDLGCGNGYVTSWIKKLGYAPVGVDAADDGVEVASKGYPDIKFVRASVGDGDFRAKVGGPFRAVVALEVLEHLYDPAALFARVNDVLAKDGVLVLSTPYHGYAKNLAISLLNGWDAHFHVGRFGGHVKFFSPQSLDALAKENGFRRVSFEGAGRVPWLWKSMVVTFVRA